MSDANADRIKELELLLEQEKGKRIAVERENYDVKRHAKQVEEQAAALSAETQASLSEAATQMKIALSISQGIWAFAHMGRAYMARKACAARVVHREQQACLLMDRIISNIGKDPAALQAAVDQAKHVMSTIKRDGEALRVQIAETAMSAGLDKLLETYDTLLGEKNDLVKGAA